MGFKVYKKLNKKVPVMLAGWPGMGNVALGCIDYIRNGLKSELIAEMDTENLSLPDSILIEGGLLKMPPSPKNLFFCVEGPPVLIFEGEIQYPGETGMTVINNILEFASGCGVKRVITGAAFPKPMSHSEPPAVYGTANKRSLLEFLRGFDVEVMEGGQISGMNGLLLGYASRFDMEAICLLATIPMYAIGFPNPKASSTILGVLERMLDLTVDKKQIDISIRKMEENMEAIEKNITEIMPFLEKDEKGVELPPAKVPSHVMEKIEKLFQEAKIDKKKAYALKGELDRWNLYKLYEDRFLNLFREHQ